MSRHKLIWIILGAIFVVLVLVFFNRTNSNQSLGAPEKQRVNSDSSRNLNLPTGSATTQSTKRILDSATNNASTVPAPKNQRVVLLSKEEQAELEGNTNNEYGIRQDILQFIEENVPKDNPKAFQAAIKLAQYENQIYYHAKNQKEALALVKKNSLASRCLMEALPTDWNKFVNGVRVKPEWEKLYDGITKPMRDTSARDQHGRDIEETYFAWQLIGTGLSSSEEKERCKSGDF